MKRPLAGLWPCATYQLSVSTVGTPLNYAPLCLLTGAPSSTHFHQHESSVSKNWTLYGEKITAEAAAREYTSRLQLSNSQCEADGVVGGCKADNPFEELRDLALSSLPLSHLFLTVPPGEIENSLGGHGDMNSKRA
nr:hypothetical protein BgiMline_026164 [Biomphalaria glabrata]